MASSALASSRLAARPSRRAAAPPPALRPGPAGARRSSSGGGGGAGSPWPALRAPPPARPAAPAGGGGDAEGAPPGGPDACAAAAVPPPAAAAAPSLDGEIARLLLPALAAVFLEPAMQVVDTALVGGRLGTAALAALGLSNLIYFFATVLFSFLLVVTTPAVAAAEAAGDRGEASAAVARGLWVALGAGAVVGGALWLAAPALLAALAPGPDVAAAAAPHLRARALAAPATLALFVANGAFRGHRDTTTPLAAGAAQNGVHLALDVALLTRPGAALPWAAGAAAAGAFVGAATMVGSLLARGLLRPADLARPPSLIAAVELLKPGAPLAACVGAVAAAVLGAANAASALGSAALAAHTVIKQVVDFSLSVFGTFSTVSQTMVAAALGAVRFTFFLERGGGGGGVGWIGGTGQGGHALNTHLYIPSHHPLRTTAPAPGPPSSACSSWAAAWASRSRRPSSRARAGCPRPLRPTRPSRPRPRPSCRSSPCSCRSPPAGRPWRAPCSGRCGWAGWAGERWARARSPSASSPSAPASAAGWWACGSRPPCSCSPTRPPTPGCCSRPSGRPCWPRTSRWRWRWRWRRRLNDGKEFCLALFFFFCLCVF